jgi:single-strand DNA-binding protein
MYENSVHLIGFLGADAESRNTRDGVPLTVLSLAAKRSWNDNKRECQSHTEWHRVTCFGQVAEFASSLKKVAHIHITGYLRSREIEKNGAGRGKKNGVKTKVWAREVRAIRISDHFVTIMLRQGDAQVFKRYSQVTLKMRREALTQLDRSANEHAANSVTAKPN